MSLNTSTGWDKPADLERASTHPAHVLAALDHRSGTNELAALGAGEQPRGEVDGGAEVVGFVRDRDPMMDAGVHSGLATPAHRVDDPRPCLHSQPWLGIRAHEAVADQLRKPNLGTLLAGHDLGETIDQRDGGGVALTVGERREVLQIAEQQRDLDRPRDVGGQGLVTKRHLCHLALHPALMHGDEDLAGEWHQRLVAVRS